MKRLPILLIVLCLSCLQWGCPEKPQTHPTLKVGMDPAIGFPFIYRQKENNKWGGFEYEIAEYLSKKTKQDLEIVEIRWEDLFQAVANKKVDLALNAIEKPSAQDNAEPPKDIAFTEHYYTAYQKLVIPNSDTFTYSLSDLKGKTVGVLASSVAEILLKTLNGLKKSEIKVMAYQTPEELFDALKKGDLNASLTERALASWYSWKSAQIKMIGDPITSATPYVSVIHKDNQRLQKQINQILTKAKKDPDFKAIFTKWHVSIKQ